MTGFLFYLSRRRDVLTHNKLTDRFVASHKKCVRGILMREMGVEYSTAIIVEGTDT